MPTPGLTHNYSTFFVQNVAEKKQNGKNVTTAKERASVYKEKGTTENSAIQMLQDFFFFFIKGQKKTCYKMFFVVSGILFATEGMKIYLFHLRFVFR